MHIKKIGDKWRCFVEKHGHRPSKTFDTKVEAQRWGNQKEAELDALKGGGGKTFQAATVHYLKTVSPHKASKNAVEWEGARFRYMAEFFGLNKPLGKITTEDISKWKNHRLESVKGSTVLREKNLLQHLFILAAEEWKWIPADPCKGVRWPEEGEGKEVTWGWRSIRRVLRFCQRGGPKTQEVGRAFHIALRTGMRLNEVLAAKLVGGVAVLPRQKTSKKDAKPVKVPLTRQARKLMANSPPFEVGANEASALFSDITLQLGIREEGEDGGLTFHDTRATFCTLTSRKVDVLTLAAMSRHRDINILRRKYYRETAEQIAARL